MDYTTKNWRTDPAAYSAHCARIRAYKVRRKERQKDRLARLVLTAAIVLLLWAVSLVAIVAA